MNESGQTQRDTDWTVARRELWQRLCDYRFGGDRAEAFLDRIGHALGCDRAGAEAALEEYRRFCFLAVVAGHAVTPSVRIDKVWHAHLTDTRDYWGRFCPQALQRELHHTPSLGGQAEDARHQEQYRQTLASYADFFDEPPPLWWPPPLSPAPAQARPRAEPAGARERLLSPWQSPPRGGYLALSLASGALGLIYLTCVRAQGTFNPLDFGGGGFLALYLAMLPWAYLAGTAIKRALRGANRRNSAQVEDEVELAYLAGGPERAVDVALVELMRRDLLALDYNGAPLRAAERLDRVWLRIDAARLRAQAAQLPAPVLAAAETAQREQSLSLTLIALARAYEPIAERLRRKGWWLSESADLRLRQLGSAPLLALAALGALKIWIGLDRDRPVGFLVVLVGLTLIVAMARLLRQQQRTRAGEWALHDASGRVAPGDLAAQVALSGTVGLYGSGFADYHILRTPPSGSSGGDSGSGSGGGGDSGGGGCGGGGGGCGGCGGG
ncbi:TIGR04222 domain-containing membrane protein [Lysobacter enzymogenes]|uniref:TIGR04222 domain-containing membrane protein n=1 Tax=Lysobacter enzymogenes TaxID=69 RepID=A0A3N2RAS4_LYSEN|nr:TIGR04222 domain-containing membrane protein [Lysobacter enzymogenes]ROU04505.1 TIGR04222 domain-containing membrane protein [Lysobacter enzymogenes]